MALKLALASDQIIQFVNFINECCCVMEDEYVGDWICLPHGFLNNLTPFEEFNQNGTEKLYRLLYFIDHDEADLVD